LSQRPFSLLDVASQRATASALRSDPLARGSLALLHVTGIVAAMLAAVGLLLTVVGDLRDESGELFDLEAQGATLGVVRRRRPGAGSPVRAVKTQVAIVGADPSVSRSSGA
jgi:hypothetical protein